MSEVYYVIYDAWGVLVFEDSDGEECTHRLTLERARYVRDHVINPKYNPRIVTEVE